MIFLIAISSLLHLDTVYCSTKLRWFKAHDLPCRFCTKKFQNIGLMPEHTERLNNGELQDHIISIQRIDSPPKCRLDDRFLSFSLDTLELMRGLRCFPLTSRKINTLVRALAPAYLRVGGTPQDFLLFADDREKTASAVKHLSNNENVVNKVDYFQTKLTQQNSLQQNQQLLHKLKQPKQQQQRHHQRQNPQTKKQDTASDVNREKCSPFFENWSRMKKFEYTRSEFSALYNFTRQNNLRLIFGLNGLTRDASRKWNPNVATKKILREYSDRVDWEIGNEPNRFNKYGKRSAVKARQLARDEGSLRTILNNTQSRIYGPDIAKPTYKSLKYLKNFLAAKPSVDAVTYHLYEMHSTVATLERYMNPMHVMKIEEEMGWIDSIVRNSPLSNTTTDIWVGETGSSSGGGAPGLSDRFVSGFHYLSKIGLAAEHCHKVLIRQSLYGGYYGMLDPVSHNPLPDYWLTVLFKRLVKNVVLSSSSVTKKDPFFRTQLYCSRNHGGADVVVSFVNMRRGRDSTLTLAGFEDRLVEKYVFSNPRDLQSSQVYLNGVLLELSRVDTGGDVGDFELPAMDSVLDKQPVLIPRASYGFLVVKNVQADACQ